ncbi:hypothetical protein ARMGADRAFT_890831, partial [Armillaria gallica]
NNSCAYDITVYVLYNTWCIASQDYKNALRKFESPWLNILVTSFTKYSNRQYTLEEVRDYFRQHLNREFPASFVFGTEMSAEAVMLKWCNGFVAFESIHYTCRNSHGIIQSSKMAYTCSLQQVIEECKVRPIARSVVLCSLCMSDVVEGHRYLYAPPLLNVVVVFMTVSPDLTIHIDVDGIAMLYHLVGIVYYGNSHFTARFTNTDGSVWFNDGI